MNPVIVKKSALSEMDEFFLNSDSEQLERIYRWARARYAAPWAVFFGVLLRVAASVPPAVQLPPVIGGCASLNLFCAFVGKSGSGKGVSDNVARAAWPGDIIELPIGSGEGIAERFARGKPGEASVPVIFTVSEIDKLAGIAGRAGSILLAELKAAAMGEPIGQANAKEDTTRIVAAQSYRMCLSVGAQPGHTRVIFDDTTGGTPQRFLWAPTTNPDMPEVATDAPAPLDTALPTWEAGDDGVVEIVYGPPEIERTIVAAHLARQRGEGNALDGHTLLMRCKVAALLAIMHGRAVVTEWDWRKSRQVMAVSDKTRESLLLQETKAKADAQRERGKNEAIRAEGRERHEIESVKNSIVAALRKRGGEASGSDLNTALGKSQRRKWLAPALAELAEEGRVVEIPVAGGARYRLVEAVQGEQPVQWATPQFNGGERAVQAERPTQPGSPINRISSEISGPKVACQKWFDAYLAEQRKHGHSAVEGSAVRQAGQAAGYSLNSLYVAANKRGLTGRTWALAGCDSAEREASLAVRGGG